MKWGAAVELGRVSNLPTVWTNVLVGAALVNPDFDAVKVLLTAGALSLLYIAGMFLNDVFDIQWDREHQPERPIVRGDASLGEVVTLSIVLIVAAMVLLLMISGAQHGNTVLASAAVLVALILLYDWKHKRWSLSPWLMGGCRMMVYLTAAALAGAWNWQVGVFGLCMLGYIAGITYSARSEHLNTVGAYWPLALLALPLLYALIPGYDSIGAWVLVVVVSVWLIRAVRYLAPGPRRQVPKAIGALLAGIALVDAAVLMALKQHLAALLAAAAFGLCLLAQRKVAAT